MSELLLLICRDSLAIRLSRFCFCGGARCAAAVGRAIAANGPRVYEPARRAQAVATLLFSNRRDHRVGCRRPADDQQEEASVNPLLYAVAVPVQPPALPRTAGPRIVLRSPLPYVETQFAVLLKPNPAICIESHPGGIQNSNPVTHLTCLTQRC